MFNLNQIVFNVYEFFEIEETAFYSTTTTTTKNRLLISVNFKSLFNTFKY